MIRQLLIYLHNREIKKNHQRPFMHSRRIIMEPKWWQWLLASRNEIWNWKTKPKLKKEILALKHLYLKNVILGPRQISGTDTDTDIKNYFIKLDWIFGYFNVFFSDNVFFFFFSVTFSFTKSFFPCRWFAVSTYFALA